MDHPAEDVVQEGRSDPSSLFCRKQSNLWCVKPDRGNPAFVCCCSCPHPPLGALDTTREGGVGVDRGQGGEGR